MPVSVHFFLETVSNKIWDDTIFLHHEERSHVIAIAPINYNTQLTKHDDLRKLGWSSLPFPEYSKKYEHNQYTLGFANHGPTFYINTINNTKAHGPNGQQHHLLPGEADPCFGTIIEGTATIDDLIEYGNDSRSSLDKDPDHPWANDSYSWSHLIKVEII